MHFRFTNVLNHMQPSARGGANYDPRGSGIGVSI